MTGGGALVILTSHGSIEEPALLRKLTAKGIDKFLAYAIPLELARKRYAKHFDVVRQSLSETDDPRVLDFNGERAFHLFSFREMGQPIAHEALTEQAAA